MKVWIGSGSEHSANLVMIGTFQTDETAEKALALISSLEQRVEADIEEGNLELDADTKSFSKKMLDLLVQSNLVSFSIADIEQFAYDHRIDRHGNQLVVTTDELDVSGFLKLMVNAGAKVEVYSAHDYPNSDFGRRS